MITLTDLYETYETPLRRFANGLTRNGPDADDLVQETFVRAMGHSALLETLKLQLKKDHDQAKPGIIDAGNATTWLSLCKINLGGNDE